VTVAIDVPDIASFIGQVPWPNDGVGIPRPQSPFELLGLGDTGVDKFVHPADETLVIGGIKKQCRSHPYRGYRDVPHHDPGSAASAGRQLRMGALKFHRKRRSGRGVWEVGDVVGRPVEGLNCRRPEIVVGRVNATRKTR
jgi:hypothetical protein